MTDQFRLVIEIDSDHVVWKYVAQAIFLRVIDPLSHMDLELPTIIFPIEIIIDIWPSLCRRILNLLLQSIDAFQFQLHVIGWFLIVRIRMLDSQIDRFRRPV